MDITLNHKFISLKYVWSYLYINILNNQRQKTHISLAPCLGIIIAFRISQLRQILKTEKQVCVKTPVVALILRLASCYRQRNDSRLDQKIPVEIISLCSYIQLNWIVIIGNFDNHMNIVLYISKHRWYADYRDTNITLWIQELHEKQIGQTWSVNRFHNSYLSHLPLWDSSNSNVAGLWSVWLLTDFQYKQRLSHASGLSSPGSAAHASKSETAQCRSGLVSEQIYLTLLNVLNKRSNATTQLYYFGRVLKPGNKPSFIYSAHERRTHFYLHHPVVFLRLLFPVIRWPAEWNLVFSTYK